MSVYQAGGGGGKIRSGRPGSIRGEAQRRGVSEYQIRKEREAAGTGAPVRTRIPWRKIAPEQRDLIRKYVPRTRWRRIVNRIIENGKHWQETGDTIDDYDYYEGFDDLYQDYSDRAPDPDEFIKIIRWYHPTR